MKSNSWMLALKIAAMLPLSFFVVFAAALLTGGGHGNFLPILVIYGPMLGLWALARSFSHDVTSLIMFFSAPCLYMAYALLAAFVRTRRILAILLTIHVLSIFIFFPFYMAKFDGAEPTSFSLFLVDIGFIGTPLAIMVMLLCSLFRNHNKAAPQTPPSQTPTDL
jgi:hypothetical protein